MLLAFGEQGYTFSQLNHDLAHLLFRLFGIALIITFVIAVIQLMNENKEGAKKLIRWMVVFLAASIIFKLLS